MSEMRKAKKLNSVLRVTILGSIIAAVVGLAFVWTVYSPHVVTEQRAEEKTNEFEQETNKTTTQVEKKSNPVLTEKILCSVKRAYATNPYTLSALASHDHNHVLTWGDGIYLDDMPLEINRVYTIPLDFAKFSPTNESVAFGSGFKDKHYIYHYKNSRLREYGPFKKIHHFDFSHDGKHFLYIVEDVKNRFSIFVDGERRFGTFTFSKCANAIFRVDSARILYSASREGNWWVFENERRKFGPFTDVKNIFVSATDRTAIIAKRSEQHYVILDGKEEGPFEKVRGFSFGPAGRRYGYVISNDGKKGETVIIDGEKMGSFETVALSPIFSLNGESVVFVVERELPPSPLKTKDERYMLGTKEFVIIINGVIRKKENYSGLDPLGMARSGIHYICVDDSGNRIVYFDAQAGAGYFKLKIPGVSGTWECQDFIRGGAPRFVSENKVSFVALKREQAQSKRLIYKVEIEFPHRLSR